MKRDEDGRPIFTPEVMARLEEHRKINCKLGEGIINVEELKKVADAQGTKAYIVEREYGYTGDIFTSLAEDLVLETITGRRLNHEDVYWRRVG